MKLQTRHRRLSILAASAVLLTLVAAPLALVGQIQTGSVEREPSVNVLAGDVFEIAGADSEAFSWSWVLTRDGTFVEASRERVFHIRLLEPGTYMLDLAVSDPATGSSARRLLPIDVQTRPLVPPARPSSSTLVVSDPASANNSVTLPANRQILRLTPTDRATGRLMIDLNAALDADGDGDAANDDEAAGMLFATDGIPLHVWYPILSVARPLVVRTAADDVTVLTVTRDGAAPADTSGLPGLPLQAGEVAVNVRGNGEVTFAMPVQYDRQDVILYRWDFGDGRASLRDAPTHRYFRDGSYTVKAEAIDMRSGTVIVSATRELTLTSQDLEPLPSTTSSSSRSSRSSSSSLASSVSSAASSAKTSSAASSVAAGTTGGSSSLLKTIGSLLLVGLLAIAAGLGLAWLAGAILKRVRASRAAAGSATGAPVITADLNAPAPAISLRKSNAAPTPPSAPAPEPAPAEPVIDIAAAPAWLKQGLEKAQTQPVPATQPLAAEPAVAPVPEAAPAPIAPVAEPAQVIATPDPVPAPVSAPEPTPAPVAAAPEPEPADETMPPWLRAADEPLVKPAPVPATDTPAPVSAPAPEPIPNSEPESAEQEEENLPPWLRGGMDAPLAPATPVQTEQIAAAEPQAPIVEPVAAVSPIPISEPVAAPVETIPATSPVEPPEPIISAVSTPTSEPQASSGEVYHEPDDQKSAEAIILDALEPPEREEPVLQPVPASVNDAATAAVAAMPPQVAPAAIETPIPTVEAVTAPAPAVQISTTPLSAPATPAPTDPQPTLSPSPTPAAPAVSSGTDAATSTKTPEQLERERERRRKKRQRYRENQRKRAAEGKPAATPNTAEQADEMDAVDAEATPDAPVVTEIVEPAATPIPTPIADPVAPATPSVPEKPAALPPSGDIAPVADDDHVAFVIRADSIAAPEEPKNDESGSVGHP